ncbi:DedA family protein [Candidatus Peregrinibacteria bacterium]|nr:MAG: DedA family protein [Candidatus Peregrinibacteria bacterium]
MEIFLESAKLFVEEYGLLGLFLFSFTEAFINPIPVAPVLGFALLLGISPSSAFCVTLIANLLGGCMGYTLGIKLGHPVALKIFGGGRMETAEKFFKKWGDASIFLLAFTPLPFKVGTWAAGIFEMRFWRFFVSATIGRTLHFGLVVGTVLFGWAFFSFLTS